MPVKRLIFATTYGHLPDVVGGLQTTIHELCLALVERGVEPAISCGFDATRHGEMYGDRSDSSLGYLVVRSKDPVAALPSVSAAFNADAICVLTGRQTVPMMICALETGIPTSVYFHNVEHDQFGGVLLPDPALLYFSNSEFTAQRLNALFGIESTTLIPLIEPKFYKLESRRKKVLCINPTHLKGVEMMFQIAEALPDIPFLFCESWNLSDRWRDYALARAAHLGNIDWVPATRDMSLLYGEAKLLLMPSIWEETYGRSAGEALINGIPVVASRRGGLPEAVGSGGVILDLDGDINYWISTVERIFQDETYYEFLCEAAKNYSLRKEGQPDFIVSKFLKTLESHVQHSNT